MSICLSVDMYYTCIYIWGSVTIAPDSNQTGCLQSGVCLSENVPENIFFVVENHTSPSICLPSKSGSAKQAQCCVQTHMVRCKP